MRQNLLQMDMILKQNHTRLDISAGINESPNEALTKSSSVISYAAPIFEVEADQSLNNHLV